MSIAQRIFCVLLFVGGVTIAYEELIRFAIGRVMECGQCVILHL